MKHCKYIKIFNCSFPVIKKAVKKLGNRLEKKNEIENCNKR